MRAHIPLLHQQRWRWVIISNPSNQVVIRSQPFDYSNRSNQTVLQSWVLSDRSDCTTWLRSDCYLIAQVVLFDYALVHSDYSTPLLCTTWLLTDYIRVLRLYGGALSRTVWLLLSTHVVLPACCLIVFERSVCTVWLLFDCSRALGCTVWLLLCVCVGADPKHAISYTIVLKTTNTHHNLNIRVMKEARKQAAFANQVWGNRRPGADRVAMLRASPSFRNLQATSLGNNKNQITHNNTTN